MGKCRRSRELLQSGGAETLTWSVARRRIRFWIHFEGGAKRLCGQNERIEEGNERKLLNGTPKTTLRLIR